MILTDKQGRTYAVTSAPIGAGLIIYHVNRETVPIARAVLNTGKGCIQDVVVYSVDDRRQGIATALYDAIEAEHGIKLAPNRTRLSDGKAFWRARQGRRVLGRMAPHYAHTILLIAAVNVLLNFSGAIAQSGSAMQKKGSVVLGCQGTEKLNNGPASPFETSILLDLEARMAFAIGDTLEMTQVTDNQIVMRNKGGSLWGNIDRVAGALNLYGEGKVGDYAATLRCVPAKPAF